MKFDADLGPKKVRDAREDAAILEFAVDMMHKCSFYKVEDVDTYCRINEAYTEKENAEIPIDSENVSAVVERPSIVSRDMPTVGVHRVPIVDAPEELVDSGGIIKAPTRVQTSLNKTFWARQVQAFDQDTLYGIRMGLEGGSAMDSGQKERMWEAALNGNRALYGKDFGPSDPKLELDTRFGYTEAIMREGNQINYRNTIRQRIDNGTWPDRDHPGRHRMFLPAIVQDRNPTKTDPSPYRDFVVNAAKKDIYVSGKRVMVDRPGSFDEKNSVMMVDFQRREAEGLGTRHQYNVEDLDRGDEAVYTYADSSDISDPRTIVGWDLVAIICINKEMRHYTAQVRQFYEESGKLSWIYVDDLGAGVGDDRDDGYERSAGRHPISKTRVRQTDMRPERPLYKSRLRNNVVPAVAVYVRREAPNQPSSLLRAGGERFVPRVGMPGDVEGNSGNMCYQTATLVALARCGVRYAPQLLRWNQLRFRQFGEPEFYHRVEAPPSGKIAMEDLPMFDPADYLMMLKMMAERIRDDRHDGGQQRYELAKERLAALEQSFTDKDWVNSYYASFENGTEDAAHGRRDIRTDLARLERVKKQMEKATKKKKRPPPEFTDVALQGAILKAIEESRKEEQRQKEIAEFKHNLYQQVFDDQLKRINRKMPDLDDVDKAVLASERAAEITRTKETLRAWQQSFPPLGRPRIERKTAFIGGSGVHVSEFPPGFFGPRRKRGNKKK